MKKSIGLLACVLALGLAGCKNVPDSPYEYAVQLKVAREPDAPLYDSNGQRSAWTSYYYFYVSKIMYDKSSRYPITAIAESGEVLRAENANNVWVNREAEKSLLIMREYVHRDGIQYTATNYTYVMLTVGDYHSLVEDYGFALSDSRII